MSAEQHVMHNYDHLVIECFDTGDIGQWPIPGERIMFGRNRLAGEAIFNATLAMTNVVVGSAWRVEELDGTLIDANTAGASTVNVSVPYYGTTRQVRIKVRKGTSSTFYQPFETLADIPAGGASVYVAQVQDE